MIARRLRWTGLIFLLVTLAGCQMAVVPEHPIDWTWSTRAGDYIRARPAFADDAVYIGSDDNSMHAVASDTGEPLWTFETADNVTSAAAVDDEGVYFGSWDGAVYALDAAGHARWRHQTDGWVSASPLLIDGVLYIGSQDGNFYALDAQTGDLVWQYTTNGRVEGDAAPVAGLVVFGSSDGYVHALDRESGRREWLFRADGPVVATPAMAGDRLFVGSLGRTLYALDATSGEPLWNHTTGAAISASPQVQGEQLFVATEGGDVFALHTADGSPLWQHSLGESIRAAPAVWDGLVFVGTADGNLYALDSATGAPLWRYRLGGSIVQAPVVADERLYAGSTAKYLQAFDLYEGQVDRREPLAEASLSGTRPFDAQEAAAVDAQAAEAQDAISEYPRLWAAQAALPDFDAVRSLHDVIAFRPQSPAAYLAHVTLARYYAQQEAPEAIESYRAALALDDNVPLRMEAARYLEAQGDMIGAYNVYREALSGGGPAGADAFASMRRTGTDPLRVAEDLSNASYYTDVLETLRDVDDPDAVPLRAKAYLGLGRYEEAAGAYRQMLRADANDDAAVMGLALTHAWLGDSQVALDLYSTVDSAESRIRQAQLLAADEPDVAIEMYLASPEPDAWWSATTLLESQGRYTETLPIYARLAVSDIQYADDAAYRLYVLGRRLGNAKVEAEGRRLLADFGMNWLALRAAGGEPQPSTLQTLIEDDQLLAKVEALEGIGRADLAQQELLYAARFREAPETLLSVAQALSARGEVVAAQTIAEQYIRDHGEGPREFWELSYPRPYAESVNAAAEAYGVDPYLVWAVMREESRFDPDAASFAAAHGLMQVIPATQMWIADELGEVMAPGDAYDIDSSIRMGAWLLGFLTRYFDGDVELAVPAYNAGAGAVEGWQANSRVHDRDDVLRWMGYDETRLYLKRVALSYQVYRTLYGQEE